MDGFVPHTSALIQPLGTLYVGAIRISPSNHLFSLSCGLEWASGLGAVFPQVDGSGRREPVNADRLLRWRERRESVGGEEN